MSIEAVQAVLERTVADPSFRAKLFAQPDQALAEYELTSEENGALRELTILTLSANEDACADQRVGVYMERAE